MRVIICGSRNSEQRDHIFARLDAFHKETPISVVIEGGQRKIVGSGKRQRYVGGVDYLAYMWGHRNKLRVITERAKWKEYGRSAGPMRNMEMLVKHKPDLVLAFLGGPGTENMVRQAKQMNIPVRRIA